MYDYSPIMTLKILHGFSLLTVILMLLNWEVFGRSQIPAVRTDFSLIVLLRFYSKTTTVTFLR